MKREVTEYIQVYQNGGTQIIMMYPGLEEEKWKETGQWEGWKRDLINGIGGEEGQNEINTNYFVKYKPSFSTKNL